MCHTCSCQSPSLSHLLLLPIPWCCFSPTPCHWEVAAFTTRECCENPAPLVPQKRGLWNGVKLSLYRGAGGVIEQDVFLWVTSSDQMI